MDLGGHGKVTLCPAYFYVLCVCDLDLMSPLRLHIHPVEASTLEELTPPHPLVSSSTGAPARFHGLGSQLVGGARWGCRPD